MHEFKRSFLLFLMILILIVAISSVSAVTDVNESLTESLDYGYVTGDADGQASSILKEEICSLSDVDSDSDLSLNCFEDGNHALCSDSSSDSKKYYESASLRDSISLDDDANLLGDTASSDNGTYYINCDNFARFFTDNILNEEYADSTLVFTGEFNDYGVLKFYSDNTRITAVNSTFNNTVFDLGASGIVLSNIRLVLDEEFSDNDYAGIYIHGDNVTVYNCTINYDAPENVTAFGIYSDGHDEDFVGLSLINNTIDFKGHALGADDYNYPILLRNTHDSVVYGNNIDCQLPIKFIMFGFSGIYGAVSMDTVAAFAADYCENLTLYGNHIHSSVNGGTNNYPTLDTVILYGCSNSAIRENTILSEDYYTPLGSDNYLLALDLHRLSDVIVVGNNISVFTNGGKSGMGTAYPIQINGPVDHVKIAFNNLTTFNHGPNCGIYSQNFYGDTFIDIISNFINVTGDATNNATNPAWCLVSGIEAQDTGDNILNNTIIVTNLGDYKSNNNVYGISYVQNTGGGHSYNIQYNNITTNGNYGVKLIGKVNQSSTVDSTVSNNVINTGTTSSHAGASTNGKVDAPGGTTVKNNTNGRFVNQMSEDDLPDWVSSEKPVIPAFDWIHRALNRNSNGTGFTDDVGNGTAPWNSHGNASGVRGSGSDGPVSGNGTNSHSDNSFRSDYDTSLGIGGSSSPSLSASSPSDVGSSAMNPDAYEIVEPENAVVKSTNVVQLAVICIIALLLIIIGYKREKDREEE